MNNIIFLNVPQILQYPELPNGCEITSLCELLSYYDLPADKCELADKYLARSEKWYGADPDEVYMGNPHLDDSSEYCGYYCFAGPIVNAARKYLADHNRNDLIPMDITGADQSTLEEQLQCGRPFIFWASLHFNDIQKDPCGGYPLANGRFHEVFHTLHCMVCCGMTDESFLIADPLNYNREVNKDLFMKVYRQLGSRAVILANRTALL